MDLVRALSELPNTTKPHLESPEASRVVSRPQIAASIESTASIQVGQAYEAVTLPVGTPRRWPFIAQLASLHLLGFRHVHLGSRSAGQNLAP